jgi:hypothetical protein
MLKHQAIDSLTSQEREIFDTCIKDVAKDRILKGWLKNMQESVDNYSKIKMLFLKSGLNVFPSTQDVLTNCSESMYYSSLHSKQ